MTSEFDIIDRYFKRNIKHRDDVIIGIGDDAAILSLSPDTNLVVTIDTMVEGVHFSPDDTPFDIGYKLMAVNLSDLAAMGARPRFATLALTLPAVDEDWLVNFSRGLFSLADQFGVALVGGDTTRGPLTLSLQLSGDVPAGQALRRDGAQADDNIYVSGTLGDAGLALRLRQGRLVLDDEDAVMAERRLCQPEPRVDTGLALRGVASSAIDISDGLLADLGHILENSAVAATLELPQLPLSTAMRKAMHGDWSLPLSSGDDYELCFTAPEAMHAAVMQIAEETGVQITCIGKIVAGSGLRCLDIEGNEVLPGSRGFDHFAGMRQAGHEQ